MAPPKRPWFRLYTETLTDPKIRRLTPSQRWLWVAVLAAARQSPIPGQLLLTETEPMTDRDLAHLADLSVKVTRAGLEKLTELGLVAMVMQRPIDADGDDPGRVAGASRARGGRDQGGEVLTVTKWNDRQFESDEANNRSKKHRSKPADATGMQRGINGDATDQSQRQRQTPSSPPPTSRPTPPNGAASGGEEETREQFIERTLTATFELMAEQTLAIHQAEGHTVHNRTGWLRTTTTNLAEQHRTQALHEIEGRTTGRYYPLHVELAEALDPRCGPEDGGRARAEARRAETLTRLTADQGAA